MRCLVCLCSSLRDGNLRDVEGLKLNRVGFIDYGAAPAPDAAAADSQPSAAVPGTPSGSTVPSDAAAACAAPPSTATDAPHAEEKPPSLEAQT